METCQIRGCAQPARARGWCRAHYIRWHRHGTTDLLVKAPRAKPVCTIDDCDEPILARQWCATHYGRWQRTGSVDLGVSNGNSTRPVRPLADRFWEKVDKTPDCWVWRGGKTTLGYGTVWSGRGGRSVMAHRVAWELLRGPLLADQPLDHLCRVPSCVNPAHLEPVTVAENTRRGYAPSLGAAFQLAKTHCPQGHPYDAENTHTNKRGGRMCRTCIRVRQRAQRQARRDGVPYVDPYVSEVSG